MTHLVTDPCITFKYTHCVDVCHEACLREGPDFLVIDPQACVDSAVCIPEYPVNTIYAAQNKPGKLSAFLELQDPLHNAHLPRQWPAISGRAAPSPDAAQWKGKTGKLSGLHTDLPAASPSSPTPNC